MLPNTFWPVCRGATLRATVHLHLLHSTKRTVLPLLGNTRYNPLDPVLKCALQKRAQLDPCACRDYSRCIGCQTAVLKAQGWMELLAAPGTPAEAALR